MLGGPGAARRAPLPHLYDGALYAATAVRGSGPDYAMLSQPRSIVTLMLAIDARRILHKSLLVLLIASAAYASILSTGYFLSLVLKRRGESGWFIFVGLSLLALLVDRRPSAAPPRQPSRLDPVHVTLMGVAFVTLAFGLYAAALSFGLLSDDFTLLERAVRHTFVLPGHYPRPLPLLVWAIVRHAGDPALHAVNVLLHGVNAALVVALARSLGLSTLTSVFAGVLFTVFPASVEAVAWTAGIHDVLLTTSCLGFVLVCAPGRRRILAMALGTLALLAALGCKETAVVAPVLAFIAWYRADERWNRSPIVWGAIVAGIYSILRVVMFHVDPAFLVSPTRRFATGLLSMLFSTLALPFTGAELTRLPALGTSVAWLFAALVVAATWRAHTDRRVAGIAVRSGLFAVVSVLPVWAGFFVSADLEGSRYLYLPACGWAILVAALLLESGARGRRLRIALTATLAVVWLLGVRSHLRTWHEAAEVRDRVLASAVSRLHTTPCSVLGFTELPDSLRGAFVFGNGFLEALQRRGTFRAKPTIGPSGEAGCTLQWDGKTFR